MPESQQGPHGRALNDLAKQLAPALVEACDGRLSDLRWFQSDWQRGGAATAYAMYEMEGRNGRPGGAREVVVKLPVGPVEHRFTAALAETEAPTPRLAAQGSEVGGYDLAWLVMERLPGTPMSADRHEGVLTELAQAAAAFQKHALSLGAPPGVRLQGVATAQEAGLVAQQAAFNWEEMLEKSRETIRTNNVADSQRWKEALKKTHKALPILAARWAGRPITGWCHGDLHAGNAMRRPEGSPWGDPGCVLLDLAEVHPGHWVEDAVYLERQHWGRQEALHGAKPVKLLAHARRDIGLDNGEAYAELANLRRVLMASTAPAFLHRDGSARYLAAALEMVERLLPQALA